MNILVLTANDAIVQSQDLPQIHDFPQKVDEIIAADLVLYTAGSTTLVLKSKLSPVKQLEAKTLIPTLHV